METAPPIQITLYDLILFLGAGQGYLFVILLAFKRQEKRVINLHLAILLFAISSELFHQFLLESHYIYQLPSMVGFALPLDALVGISLYWYVRIITHPELDHSFKRVFIHYSIFFACFLLSLPYWALDFEDKLSLMQTGVIPEDWPALAYYATLAQVPIKILSFSLYLLLAVRLLLDHRQRIKKVFSNRQKVTLNWLSYLLLLFAVGLINGLIILLFFQEYQEQTQLMGFLGVFSMAAVFYLGIMGLMQPVIYLRKEQSFLEQEQKLLEEKAQGERADEQPRYRKSALAEQDMQRIATRLDDSMRQQQLYLDPGLTMPKLAANIGVSPNYLSQTLNSLYQVSFFDYVNGMRVEFAKALLADENKQGLSIVDIAMESAFNSRSTFYAAFKKSVGMTPAQYRQAQAAETANAS